MNELLLGVFGGGAAGVIATAFFNFLRGSSHDALDALNRINQSQLARISALESELAELQLHFSDLREDIGRLQSEKTAMDRTVAALEQERRSCRSRKDCPVYSETGRIS